MSEFVEDPFGTDSFELPGLPTRKVRGHWRFVRELDPRTDMPLLQVRVPAPKQTLTQIRHTHHQLARLLATGTKEQEASLITGYKPTYISVLKGDPSFQDLMEYYAAQREQIFVDVVERMRSLGLATIDELQARLEEEPDEFSRRELMELAELMLIKPMSARTPLHTVAPVAPVSLSVKFVTAQPPPETKITIIEHSPTDRLGSDEDDAM
jgi:hypothetical protein